jgi:hypothetical protein
VKNRTSPGFRRRFRDLPDALQHAARRAYGRLKVDPGHPGLQLKRIQTKRTLVSVRVSDDYRALGEMQDDETVVWFWIGPHHEYDRLIGRG